ncbi:unnamed protein product [Adineta ricciae]|uniref:Uncharacterized protein n=1 Tax=Adineta ricciae TaxID=249248 RepID=A0A814H8G9_ADIRI|nr:unnamed protein product [Adineta ricciae]CAF1249925.1 unnamed protein product [Adineta ricciae]
MSCISIQSSMEQFSQVAALEDKLVRCFRTNNMKVKLSDTGFFENVNEQANLFYHGTISEYATQILEFGIPGGDSFSSSDFEPGYYLNTSFTDARD